MILFLTSPAVRVLLPKLLLNRFRPFGRRGTRDRLGVDHIFVRSLHAMDCFYFIAPDVKLNDLTDAKIETFITNIAKSNQASSPNSAMIEETLRGMWTNMSIIDPTASIYQVALEYEMRMVNIGYESFH